MHYDKVVKNIVENYLAAWNASDFNMLRQLSTDDLIVVTEPINLPQMKTERIEVSGIENCIAYWNEMKRQFNVAIERYEIIETGSTSKVKCFYTDSDLIVECIASINEYGLCTKFINIIC